MCTDIPGQYFDGQMAVIRLSVQSKPRARDGNFWEQPWFIGLNEFLGLARL